MSTTFPPTEDQISAIAASYAEETKTDYVGLWQICIRVRKDFGTTSDAENKRIVIEVVKKMLSDGLDAVTLSSSGPGCIKWKNQDPSSILSFVKKEWDSLGRQPSVGEIIWFDNSDSGRRS